MMPAHPGPRNARGLVVETVGHPGLDQATIRNYSASGKISDNFLVEKVFKDVLVMAACFH